MENESLSFQDEGDRSGDVIMSDNDIDPNYEPSEDEVLKYAIYLGIDPEEDRDFLYIAREGLKAPVSKPWRACQTRSGEIYYFNFETGESQWDHPSDDIFRKKFQELKALCNKSHHKRGEQKVLKQMQKKQQVLQASKGFQENKQDSNYFDNEGNQSIGSIEKENLQPNSFQKSSKQSFFDDNQVSLDDKCDYGIDDQEYNNSQNPLNQHIGEPSFEQSEGLLNGEIQSLRKVSTMKKENPPIEDEGLPETKNFYDDASINNESTIQLEGNNYLEGTKSSGIAGIVDFENEENIPFDNKEEDENKNNLSIKEEENELQNSEQKLEENQSINQEWGSQPFKGKSVEGIGSIEKNSNEDKMFYEESEGQVAHEVNISGGDVGGGEDVSKEEFHLGQELEEKAGSMQSIEPEKEQQLQMSFDSQKHKEALLKKSQEPTSIVFSDFQPYDTEKKSGKRDTIVTLDEIEHDFGHVLKQYEEELGAKFSKMLGEYEQNYHKEASQIYKEYQEQIAEIRRELEHGVLHDKNSTSFENEIANMRKKLTEKNEHEISDEIQNFQTSFENKKRDMEKEEENYINNLIREVRHHQDLLLDQEEEELRYNIEENIDKIDKIKKETLKGNEKLMDKEAYEAKKKETIKEYEQRLKNLEQEQNEILQSETENFKAELDEKFENEKELVMEAFEHSQEEFKALKIQITKDFERNLNEEMNKLHKRHEKAIKDLEKEELAKAEERALHNAYNTHKPEHDKKMNALQVERMLYEKQSKKRLEEAQQQIWKKFELDRVNFENQKNGEIKLLSNETNSILNHLLTKENQMAAIEKQVNEMDTIEKESVELNDLINQLNIEIADLEAKSKDSNSNIDGYQNKLHDLKKKLITKNHTVNKINDLHHQLDNLEQEISLTRERLSHHRASQADSSMIDAYYSHTSTNNFNRLLREVEEIKSVVKKRVVKKSSSVNRFGARGHHDLINRTIDASRIMNTEAEFLPENEEVSKSILEEHLDKEPTLEINKIIRKSHETGKRNGPTSSTNRFLDDKRPKEQQFISHSYTHNHHDSFQKSKSEWKSIIEKERKTLDKFAQMLHQRKVEIREIQEQLKKEQEQYKIEYTSFKNSTTKSSTKKLQLEIFKKSLNDKIYEYNRKLCQMRDKENIMKSKKELLKKLENGYKDTLSSMNPNQTNLTEIYQEYRKLSLDSPSDNANQSKSGERQDVLYEKSQNISIDASLADGGRFNLNLVEILHRNKSIQDKNHTNRLDEGSKENYQLRANGPEAKTKSNEKPPSAVFQRKFLRKPSPGPLTNYKTQLDQSKTRQDAHYTLKK